MSEGDSELFEQRYRFSRVFYTAMVYLGVIGIVFIIFWAFPSADELNQPNYGFGVIKITQFISGIVTGIFTIAAGQIGQATVDNANANLETLALLRCWIGKHQQ